MGSSDMRCPTLKDLPEPPSGKRGWPWTEESVPLPPTMSDGQSWPRLSVITPSFNQGRFLEATLRSVLLQGYPNLEYFVLDGGSTDNSVEILQKYSPWLSSWVSEPDGGQSAAINRGLHMSSGLYATWINSDDMLYKNALVEHGTRIGFAKNTVYVGKCFYTDVTGRVVTLHEGRVHSLEDLLRIKTIWRSCGNIVQPEVLFPLELALKVGGLNADKHFTMDYELWGKLFLAGARFQYTGIPFGMFRLQPEQKTHQRLHVTRELIETAVKLVPLADSFSEETRSQILADLDTYWLWYQKNYWKSSGRLAKIGLPPIIVRPLRGLRSRMQKARRAYDN